MLMKKIVNSTSKETLGVQDREILNWLGIDPDGELGVAGAKSLKEATVYACIDRLSKDIAKLPVKLYKDDGNAKLKIANHPVMKLLKLRPNPHMSAYNYRVTLEVQRNLYGNAYSYIDVDSKGKIKGLYPLHAPSMQILVDDANVLPNKQKFWYVYSGNGGTYWFHPDEILHYKGMTNDGIIGMSPIDKLRHLVENSKASQEYINKFFKNGLQAKGVVQYTGDLDPAAERKMLQRFENMSNGLKNAHKYFAMPLGFQFQPINLSMADAQFLENSELSIRQIAAAFGIKMHQINELSRATFNNASEQQSEYYQESLLPILTMYEQEDTYKLLFDSEIEAGMYFKTNVDAILRTDIKTRYEAYRTAIQSGFLTVNEVRENEEKPAKEGGDELLINGNMMKIHQAGNQYLKGGENNEEQPGEPSETEE